VCSKYFKKHKFTHTFKTIYLAGVLPTDHYQKRNGKDGWEGKERGNGGHWEGEERSYRDMVRKGQGGRHWKVATLNADHHECCLLCSSQIVFA